MDLVSRLYFLPLIQGSDGPDLFFFLSYSLPTDFCNDGFIANSIYSLIYNIVPTSFFYTYIHTYLALQELVTRGERFGKSAWTLVATFI